MILTTEENSVLQGKHVPVPDQIRLLQKFSRGLENNIKMDLNKMEWAWTTLTGLRTGTSGEIV
jgi:hypothetical protein